jgi:4-alpha-glucanotransferase
MFYRRNQKIWQILPLNPVNAAQLAESDMAAEFIRLAYSSVAKTAIIPLQDILNLEEASRMNIHSASEG